MNKLKIKRKEKISKMDKETKNLVSLILGIIGIAITIPLLNALVIPPALFLVIGAILALLGSFRKW